MKKIRILLADDHQTVREGLKQILSGQPDIEIVGEVADGRAAVERAQALKPDIVLMDISMPELNGLGAARTLRETCPQVKILTLTRHTDDAYVQEVLRSGASGYVLKQSPADELLRAVRAVAEGKQYLDSALTNRVMGAYLARHSKVKGEPRPGISERETEVLRLMAWGHSNKEIAEQLQISVKTVEVHKANAMKKLQFRSRIDIVRFAVLQGWLQDN